MPKKILSRKPGKPRRPVHLLRDEFAERLLHHLQKMRWCVPGQRIAVAVSGGADSVALLFLLLELRTELGIALSVVHFNHKLRGPASDADEMFVRKLAGRYDLPFFADREDIAAKSQRDKANLEEAARLARYAFFERLVAEGRLDRVAVAHTADDQAETVLAHILRGTGLAGLAGIHPEFGCVVRPLLKFRRAEVRGYLRARRRTWREDASNRDAKRLRARIRLRLMPLLEKQFQPGVVEHLGQLADFAREDAAWLESSAELRVFLNAQEEKGEWRIPIADLVAPQRPWEKSEDTEKLWSRDAPQAMSKRLIRLLVKKVKPYSGQLTAVHVEAVLRLAQQPDSGKSLDLPGGVQVRRQRDSLVFRPSGPGKDAQSTGEAKAFCYPVELGEGVEISIVEQSCSLRFRVIDWPPQGRETKMTGAVLDRDRIRLPLVVRNWRPGDWIRPLGHQKPRKLARLLNELGVSRWDKALWPVVTCGEQTVWVRGLPVAAEFAAGDSTRQGVLITEVPNA